MTNLKAGDRIRRIGNPVEGVAPLGFETQVVEIREGRLWYNDIDGYKVHSEDTEGLWELIESSGPVRTVTRKEVVTGVYGRISVSQQGGDDPRLLIALADLGGNVNMVHQGWSLDELSEVITNLTAIRDALREQGK
jgi:hypothetical protein